MNIKLKDILKVVSDDECVHLYGPGLVLENHHVSGKASMFRKYFSKMEDRYVERLCVFDNDLFIFLLPAGEEVQL